MTIMATTTTIQRPERRAVSKTEENCKFVRSAKEQFKQRQLGVESLLRRLTTSNMRSMLGDRPILIPAHLVPGHMRADSHKKVKGSETLVLIGAGTE
jgi:hypothetical protein